MHAMDLNYSNDIRKSCIAVILIVGFLGSGKTTLLKSIINSGEDLSDTIILVNEFGSIGIDSLILKNNETRVIELTNGCICCTIQTSLVETLKDIDRSFHPRRILIEATGVAEPAAVWAVLNQQELREKIDIQRTVTVLDVRLWKAREVLGDLFYNQLQDADLILLNKIDILDGKNIEKILDEIHKVIPDSMVIPTVHCNVDPEIILTNKGAKPAGIERCESGSQQRENCEADIHNNINPKEQHQWYRRQALGHEHQFVSFSFIHDKPLNENLFKGFIEKLPWEVFRVKGPVHFPDRTVLLNHAGGISEWMFWEYKPETRLTFVGWNINANEVIRQLKECIL